MNEFEFIRRLRSQTESRPPSERLIKGIGDDAAVVAELADRNLVITSDLLVQGVDFYRDATPAHLLGHKALAVSLSDIAAMGARPFWSLVSIGMPDEVWQLNFKEDFFQGYLALADPYNVNLAGGDTSRTIDRVVIDSIVIGEVRNGEAVMRSGARPGDQIFVTGTLGGAAAGLKLIEMGARLGGAGVSSLPAGSPAPSENSAAESAAVESAEGKAIEAVLLRQLRPAPRVGWGMILGEQRLATAMIDISDGLSSDIAHLCAESGVGAQIEAAQIPLDQDVATLCGRRALDPLLLALHGGEDFELLFTVRSEDVSRLPKRVDGVPLAHLGEITDQSGTIRVLEKNRVWDLQPGGFQHFKP